LAFEILPLREGSDNVGSFLAQEELAQPIKSHMNLACKLLMRLYKLEAFKPLLYEIKQRTSKIPTRGGGVRFPSLSS
jgi:hypothetical protein